MDKDMSRVIWNNVAAVELNQESMNKVLFYNMEFLYEKPLRQVVLRDEADITFTTTPVDIAHITHGSTAEMEQFQGEWFSTFQGVVSNSNNTGDIVFDIRVENAVGTILYYVSSGTTTPRPRGIASVRDLVANLEVQFNFWAFSDTNSTNPLHWYLQVFSSSGTGTLHLAGAVAQWTIEAFGGASSQSRNQRIWNKTKDWVSGENITEGKLQQHVKDKVEWLHDKNYDVMIDRDGVSHNTTSVTFVPVDEKYVLNLKTNGGDVMLRFSCSQYTNSVASRINYLDVKIDDDYFLSSLTSTPLSDGIWNYGSNPIFPQGIAFEILIPNLEAGWHKFELYFKTSNADSAMSIFTLNSPAFFMVEEYCLTG